MLSEVVCHTPEELATLGTEENRAEFPLMIAIHMMQKSFHLPTSTPPLRGSLLLLYN
jgi:hypothetical protein